MNEAYNVKSIVEVLRGRSLTATRLPVGEEFYRIGGHLVLNRS